MRALARLFPPGSRVTAAFFALVFVTYTCVFPYIGRVNNPNENVRSFMTMAIVDHHTFRLDQTGEILGYVGDAAVAPDKHTGELHRYSLKGPAMGLAGVPVYWVFKKIAPLFHETLPIATSTIEARIDWLRHVTLALRLFVVQLPCFAFLVWFERWLRRTTSDQVLRLCAVAAVGLGTNFLAHSLMFVSHALVGVVAFASFGITTREKERFPDEPLKRRSSMAFLAGLFAGLASLLEYSAFVVSVGLAVYALTAFARPRRLVWFLAGASLNAAILLFYQWRCFNNPFLPGYKLAENPTFAAFHKTGFFGLGLPTWGAFKDLTTNPTIGFFGTSSFMWLGLLAVPFVLFVGYGTPVERRVRRTATLAWMLTIGALFVALSCASEWQKLGGWAVGPRLLGPAPPFMAFGACSALEWIGRRGRLARGIVRGAAGGLALASAAQIGFVSVVYNTLPSDLARPLWQFAIPMARAGFVPHHAGELFGWKTPTAWYLIVAGMFLAILLAALAPNGDRPGTVALRVLVILICFPIGVAPSFTHPKPDEVNAGTSTARYFSDAWEPSGRDRIHALTEEAERFGPRKPCLWYKVAMLERLIGRDLEALRDERRAGSPIAVCRWLGP
jgi:hypothetical protein